MKFLRKEDGGWKMGIIEVCLLTKCLVYFF